MLGMAAKSSTTTKTIITKMFLSYGSTLFLNLTVWRKIGIQIWLRLIFNRFLFCRDNVHVRSQNCNSRHVSFIICYNLMKISADHYLDMFWLLTNIQHEIQTSVLMLQLMLITNFQDCSMIVVYIIFQTSKTILL